MLRGIRILAAAGLVLFTTGATAVASSHLWEDIIHVPPLTFRQLECWYIGEEAVVNKYGPAWRKLTYHEQPDVRPPD